MKLYLYQHLNENMYIIHSQIFPTLISICGVFYIYTPYVYITLYWSVAPLWIGFDLQSFSGLILYSVWILPRKNIFWNRSLFGRSSIFASRMSVLVKPISCTASENPYQPSGTLTYEMTKLGGNIYLGINSLYRAFNGVKINSCCLKMSEISLKRPIKVFKLETKISQEQ